MGDRVGAADPAADLVQLGQAEHVGALDDQRVGLGDVEPRLDDGGRHQHVEVAAQELHHHALERALGHLAVADADAQLRHPAGAPARPPRRSSRPGCAGRTTGPRGATSRRSAARDQLRVELADVGPDRAAAARRRRDHRDVAQAGQPHVQRARDRRRRHRQHVHLEPQLPQELLLGDAEALLLVHDHEPEVLRARRRATAPDGCRSGCPPCPRGTPASTPLTSAAGAEPRHHLDPHREVAEAVAERRGVLLGEDRRRHQHQHLAAAGRRP